MGSSFIHLIRTDSNAFFLTAEYSIVYMYHSFLMHSSADRHLGWEAWSLNHWISREAQEPSTVNNAG